MNQPFRKVWVQPAEKKSMNEQEMHVGIAKAIAYAFAAAVIAVVTCVQGANVYHYWCGLQIAQLSNTADGRAAAEARAVENKAAADRAMFESMKK